MRRVAFAFSVLLACKYELPEHLEKDWSELQQKREQHKATATVVAATIGQGEPCEGSPAQSNCAAPNVCYADVCRGVGEWQRMVAESVDANDLQVGQSYRSSGAVPLMPDPEPKGEIAIERAVAGASELAAGSPFRVLSIRKGADDLSPDWFQVSVSTPDGKRTGWIKFEALLGDHITAVAERTPSPPKKSKAESEHSDADGTDARCKREAFGNESRFKTCVAQERKAQRRLRRGVNQRRKAGTPAAKLSLSKYLTCKERTKDAYGIYWTEVLSCLNQSPDAAEATTDAQDFLERGP